MIQCLLFPGITIYESIKPGPTLLRGRNCIPLLFRNVLNQSTKKENKFKLNGEDLLHMREDDIIGIVG